MPGLSHSRSVPSLSQVTPPINLSSLQAEKVSPKEEAPPVAKGPPHLFETKAYSPFLQAIIVNF